MTTKKMKAIVTTGYGSPDVFELRNVQKPKPESHEILVKVKTSAATRADTMMRIGKPYFARLFLGLTKPNIPIPGTGFAGVVEEVGKGVTNFKAGDHVFGETAFGFSANAEYLTVSSEGVVLPLPDTIDFSEAANFCDGHLTSFNFLKEIANLKGGQDVLVNGASGALGTSAVQLAKYFGATVTAVCSEANWGLVKSLGADSVIDYRVEDFTKLKERYDIVYDAVGQSSYRRCKKILKSSGLYLSPVLNFSLLLDVFLTSLRKGKKAKFEATGANPENKLRGMLEKVLNIYREGKLKTIIDRQFPLEKLKDAHIYIDTGRKKGNVVIYNT